MWPLAVAVAEDKTRMDAMAAVVAAAAIHRQG
jgi:hypothetical protein